MVDVAVHVVAGATLAIGNSDHALFWAGCDESSPMYRTHWVRSLIFEKLSRRILLDLWSGSAYGKWLGKFQRAVEKGEGELLCPAI
jgi:hypothetical protein